MSLPLVVPEREPLTMAEARRIGEAARKLARFRYLLAQATEGGGSINVAPGSGKLFGENLRLFDVQACLALLIEREEQFLASMGVELREPTL